MWNFIARLFAVRVVVAVSEGEDKHDIVEVYLFSKHANKRRDELLDSGFKGRHISVASRLIKVRESKSRKYGSAWKLSTGWTP